MLISISGSQGCGKSLLIQNLKKNTQYKTIDRKTSRSILQQWNKTLQDINSNIKLSIEFQDEIIKRKYADEQIAINDKDNIWITERSYTDLFTYALINIGKFNKYNSWLNQYYNKCNQYNKSYHGVFFVRNMMLNIDNDGVRSINKHYATMIDNIMFMFTSNMFTSDKIHVINTIDLTQRTNKVIHTIDVINVKNKNEK